MLNVLLILLLLKISNLNWSSTETLESKIPIVFKMNKRVEFVVLSILFEIRKNDFICYVFGLIELGFLNLSQ